MQLSRTIIRERLNWLGHLLRMKDDIWTNIVLASQPSRVKWKSGRPQMGSEVCVDPQTAWCNNELLLAVHFNELAT